MATQPNWALLDFCYTHWNIGLVIVAVTNYPCHLKAYTTDKPPLKHPMTRVLRGLRTPWGTYFCFVAYTEYDQAEPGDTTTHTFWINDWYKGQRRWWLLHGTVGGADSPSNTPIFDHTHPGGLPEYVDLRPNNPGDLCTILGGVPHACPNHYLDVDDVIPDEHGSYIGQYFPLATQWKDDLYRLQTIVEYNIISINFTVRISSDGTRPGTRVFKFGLKTNGVHRKSAKFASTFAWQNHSWLHTTNPVTGNPWTSAELNLLQAGVSCATVMGVGWAQYSRCTQLFITLHRGLCTPNPTPGPYP